MANQCVNCSAVSSNTVKLSWLTTKFKNQGNTTVAYAIEHIFKLKTREDQQMCSICIEILKPLYTAHIKVQESYKKFTNRTCSGSFITNLPASSVLYKEAVYTQTTETTLQNASSQTIALKNQPRTPIGRKMMNIRKDKIKQKAFYGTLTKIVRGEIIQLAKISSLREDVTRQNSMVPFEAVGRELKTYAPLISAILNGLCRKRNDDKSLKLISTVELCILAVALHSKNRNCNRLQKLVGIALWKTKASAKTYGVLNHLGLSCSYQTVNRVLDHLRIGYDLPIKVWQQAVSHQLRHPSIPIPSEFIIPDLDIVPMESDGEDTTVKHVIKDLPVDKKRRPSQSPTRANFRVAKNRLVGGIPQFQIQGDHGIYHPGTRDREN